MPRDKTLIELIHESRRHALSIQYDIPKSNKQNYKHHVEGLKQSLNKAVKLVEQIPDELPE